MPANRAPSTAIARPASSAVPASTTKDLMARIRNSLTRTGATVSRCCPAYLTHCEHTPGWTCWICTRVCCAASRTWDTPSANRVATARSTALCTPALVGLLAPTLADLLTTCAHIASRASLRANGLTSFIFTRSSSSHSGRPTSSWRSVDPGSCASIAPVGESGTTVLSASPGISHLHSASDRIET